LSDGSNTAVNGQIAMAAARGSGKPRVRSLTTVGHGNLDFLSLSLFFFMALLSQQSTVVVGLCVMCFRCYMVNLVIGKYLWLIVSVY
jgi:hypothetical protein